jgi:hypothetical protein
MTWGKWEEGETWAKSRFSFIFFGIPEKEFCRIGMLFDLDPSFARVFPVFSTLKKKLGF